MKCPVCNVDLVTANRQGVETDHHARCRGVSLDRGDLDMVIEPSAAERSHAPSAEPAVKYHGHHDHDPRRFVDTATTADRNAISAFLGTLLDFDWRCIWIASHSIPSSRPFGNVF
jgi:Zn-finger nucleic acid-binding protein